MPGTAKMKGMWALATGFNVVTAAVLFVNFSLISLNLVFTFADLPVAVIPYYDTTLGKWQTERFFFEWWEIGTDVLRIAYPLLLLNVLAVQCIFGKSTVIGSLIAIVILGVLDVAKLVWRIVQWGFCDNHQHCRGYTSPDSINYIFAVHIGITAYFSIIAIAYGFIITEIKKAAEKDDRSVIYVATDQLKNVLPTSPGSTEVERAQSAIVSKRYRGGGGGPSNPPRIKSGQSTDLFAGFRDQ